MPAISAWIWYVPGGAWKVQEGPIVPALEVTLGREQPVPGTVAGLQGQRREYQQLVTVICRDTATPAEVTGELIVNRTVPPCVVSLGVLTVSWG